MTEILKIAEKAVPLLDELDLKSDVVYRVELMVKRNLHGTYTVFNMTLEGNPAVPYMY